MSQKQQVGECCPLYLGIICPNTVRNIIFSFSFMYILENLKGVHFFAVLRLIWKVRNIHQKCGIFSSSCCFLFAKKGIGAVCAELEIVWSALGPPPAVGVCFGAGWSESVMSWCWGTSAGQWREALHCPAHVLSMTLGSHTLKQEGKKGLSAFVWD